MSCLQLCSQNLPLNESSTDLAGFTRTVPRKFQVFFKTSSCVALETICKKSVLEISFYDYLEKDVGSSATLEWIWNTIPASKVGYGWGGLSESLRTIAKTDDTVFIFFGSNLLNRSAWALRDREPQNSLPETAKDTPRIWWRRWLSSWQELKTLNENGAAAIEVYSRQSDFSSQFWYSVSGVWNRSAKDVRTSS